MVTSFFSKVARRIKKSMSASVATPIAAATNNPWNANEPVSYDGMWLGCNTCVKHVQRKVSGDENTHWLTYAMQKYLGGAIGQFSGDKDSNRVSLSHLGS
jgi:hypothetical protein